MRKLEPTQVQLTPTVVTQPQPVMHFNDDDFTPARARQARLEKWCHQVYQSLNPEFIYARNMFLIEHNGVIDDYSIQRLEDYFFLRALREGFGKHKDVCRVAVREILRIERAKVRLAMMTQLCPETLSSERREFGEQQLSEFLFYMTGKRSELDFAVMKHFFWQVKRKLRNLPVDHHMMAFFYGNEQGSGKSTSIRRLLAPLNDLALEENFNVFTDARRTTSFERYYVLFLDEMGEASKADMATVKGIITGERVGHRKLYQDDEASVQINTTLIGASNKPLHQLLKDDHMRRFWQINVQSKATLVTLFPQLKALNYASMWDSVHHDDPCTIGSLLTRLEALQVDLTSNRLSKRFYNDWLDPSPDARVSPETLYHWFETYCRALGVEEGRWESKQIVWRELSAYGVQKVKSGGCMKYCVRPKTEVMHVLSDVLMEPEPVGTPKILTDLN